MRPLSPFLVHPTIPHLRVRRSDGAVFNLYGHPTGEVIDHPSYREEEATLTPPPPPNATPAKPPRLYKHWSDDEKALAVVLAAQCFSPEEIATRLGRSVQAVHGFFRRHTVGSDQGLGLTLRDIERAVKRFHGEILAA